MFLVNSPIVRGDNLQFREEGVREVISRVLPWLNSFRFFLGQVALLKKTSGHKFKYNPHAPVPQNVMDRWILARCQSLIKLVTEEMAAYRLYTIILRLLDLVDELTKLVYSIQPKEAERRGWGGRHCGSTERPLQDSVYALQNDENLYQSLRQYIPEDPNRADTRSIHFLSFPQVKEEYFDADIERQVARVQSVLESTRNIREKSGISLKTPLKELLVFHPDPKYLADITPLQRYIESELNIRDIVFSSDESLAGVRYRAVADWSVLGRKLRKDLGRVKNNLPKATSDEVKQYISTGKLTVDGIELVQGDLSVQRYLEVDVAQYGTHADNDVVVRLDIQIHPELQGEWLARELINRVQKLRETAGLQATDDVDVYYSFESNTGAKLIQAIKYYKEFIQKTVGSTPTDVTSRKAGGSELIMDREASGFGMDSVACTHRYEVLVIALISNLLVSDSR
ncbi:isoleucine--tRNA ligase [Marasmius tenuissimus]|nr:isoleucine--tRNA ligase [Marasmius tenuissimus]